MTTAMKLEYTDNILQFPMQNMQSVQQPAKRTNSPFKSNGQPKATAADPIRDITDVHKMQEYFKGKKQIRNYMLITLGISFALRAGDLLSLRIEHIYNKDGSVKNYVEIYEDKTNKRNKIRINSTCKAALEQYLEFLEKSSDGIIFTSDPLFASREKDSWGRKKALTLRQLNNILKKAAKECGVEDHVSSHSMRKTYAYQAMQAHGENQETLYALQYTFNHSDIRTTMRYTGMQQDKADKLREEIGNMLEL
ncbi:tyrosine-type recombinase/integrase [Anaerovoracaceae bacterium 41-7]